ncbi:hypothetical protein ASC66_03640 [Leifsonia sp. Root4]|uniref:hypothetical protein n=1 Tax=Leifsonia sp. Root4 TaxID=1736525 RepID=UPI0006FB2B9D|nr:hypothetical protein [Leifsonia sp. Root4]KQW08050.1 hypothetical protein ASC66_03640 [Leifsonia sp. Root4]
MPDEDFGDADRDDAIIALLVESGEAAGLKRLERPDSLVVLRDPEMIYTLSERDGLFIVQSSGRGTAPWLAMASEQLEAAAAGLLLLIAVPLRQRLGLPHLEVPRELTDGVTLVPDVDGLRLRWSAAGQPRSAWFPDSHAGRRSAVELSHAAGHPPEMVAVSVRDQRGAPLFARK